MTRVCGRGPPGIRVLGHIASLAEADYNEVRGGTEDHSCFLSLKQMMVCAGLYTSLCFFMKHLPRPLFDGGVKGYP